MRGILKFTATITIVAMFSLGLSGCGNQLKKEQPEMIAEGKTLFEAGLQYVKVVDIDVRNADNDHPFVISSANMRTVLESLYVTETVLFSDRQSPLFSPFELQILSAGLSSGLARAEANEDVTFVTIGTQKAALSREQQTNTGRVFYSGGRLNIIFGELREEYLEKDRYTGQEIDRRVNPLRPGSRLNDSDPNVRIALDNGQSYYIDPETGVERNDWIVIDIPTVLATMAEREESMRDGMLNPELREDIARNKQETRNLREDMANIKEVLFEMSDKLDKLQQEIDVLKSD